MSEPHTADLGTRYRYRQEGAALERERIIKLLEDEIANVSNPMMVDREFLDGLERSLDLIKGEQK